MALNYETLIRAAKKSPEERTATEVNDFIFPWLKQSLKKKQGIFQKISDEIIYDICKSVILEQRPAWDVVIRQGDPGDKFYIILQGAVKIYRTDDEAVKLIPTNLHTVVEFGKLDQDPEKREEMISQAFGSYIVTLEGTGFSYRALGGFDFGERALITNEPRSATVITVVPTDLLVVDREVFSRTLEAAHLKELQEKNDFINRCPLFCTWPERIKRLVSLNLERERYAYDSVLYRQGARADAIYFIWNGELKVSVDPLLHYLQYPNFFAQKNKMREQALDYFTPILQNNELSDVRLPSIQSMATHRDSFVRKRRMMTYSQAENQRRERILHMALLTSGDILGLDSYICELPTYMDSARCTSPCDLFYIFKHNFVRLQKRQGITEINEHLREMVRLSWSAYPMRVIQTPLFQTLIEKQLSKQNKDDQHQNNNVRPIWSFYSGNRLLNNVDRPDKRSAQLSNRELSTRRSATANEPPSRSNQLADGSIVRTVSIDYANTERNDQRLKQWHENYITDSKAKIWPLKKCLVVHSVQKLPSKLKSEDSFKSQFDKIPVLTKSLQHSFSRQTHIPNRAHVS